MRAILESRFVVFARGRLVRFIGSVLSTGLFIWLLSRQNWSLTLAKLRELPAWLIPLAIGLYFLAVLLNSWRWNVLLRAQRVVVPYLDVVKMVITGAYASNFLPSTIGGDSIRIVGLMRYDTTLTLSTASVVLDRFINVLATLTMLPFSLVIFGSSDSFLPLSLSGNQVGLAVVGLSSARLASWKNKLVGWLGRFIAILKIWLNQPIALLLAFGFAWLSTFVVFVAVWFLALGLGMGLSLTQVIAVMALTYLITLLPISINGFGLRELTISTLYMHLGATLEQATTLAVVTRFILLLVALPGAFWLPGMVKPDKKLLTTIDS